MRIRELYNLLGNVDDVYVWATAAARGACALLKEHTHIDPTGRGRPSLCCAILTPQPFFPLLVHCAKKDQVENNQLTPTSSNDCLFSLSIVVLRSKSKSINILDDDGFCYQVKQ